MPAKANTTTTNEFSIKAREVDFVTRFALNWEHLREIMGIMRPIRKTSGTKLTSKYAEVTLESGNVGEGAEIPYSQAVVKEKEYGDVSIEKYAKAVTIEAIDKYGYDNAIAMTDDQFLFELQSKVTGRFYDFIKTGTLRRTENTFQAALAMAQGAVRNRWLKMHRSTTAIVGFCNILDLYEYLSSAQVTVQTMFGLNYIQNFLGYSTLFLLSENEIPKGKVIATPAENIVLYYVDPSDSGFARAGLEYRTDGETNLIGFHVNGNYNTAVSESFALMGMYLWAEYLDGIAVVTIGSETTPTARLSGLTIGNISLTPAFDPDVVSYTATTKAATNKVTAVAEYEDDATVEIKLGNEAVDNGSAVQWASGSNTLTAKVTNGSATKTYTVTVTKS